MGYRVEVAGPERPALVSLRVGAEASPAVEAALGAALPRIRVRTGRMDSRLRGNNGKREVDVIPAKAGIHGFSDQRSSRTRKPDTDALPPPAALATGNGTVTVFGLGPDEWLVRAPPDEEERWLERLEAAVAGSFAAAVLVSDAWSVFTVTGPDTLDVLARSTGVDVHPSAFPTGRAVRAGFARTSALIHRLDDRPSFDVYVDASLARYAGRWLESAIGGRS